MAVTLREFVTKWGFRVDDAELAKLDSKFAQTRKNMKQVANRATDLGKKLSLGLTLPIAAAGAGFIKAAADMETIQTQFKVLTGSTEDAVKLMAELQEFSATTPFQFSDIARASQQLLGFQFAAEEIEPLMRKIGDVAAASGKPVGDLALIFGQVRAAGKLTGERLLQLQERAVPIGPALAKTLGVPETAIKDLVSKGQVDFDKFAKAFGSLSEEGGAAFGGMIELSTTFNGLVSTLKDNIVLMAATFGKDLLPVAKRIVESFTGMVQWFTRLSPAVRTAIFVFGGILAVLGPLLLLTGFLINAVLAIRTAMFLMGVESLKAWAKFALGFLAVLAILAVGFLIFEDLKGFFEGKDSVTGRIIRAIDELVNSVGTKFPLLGAIITSVLTVITAPIRLVISLVRGLAGAIGALVGGGGFGLAFDAIKEAAGAFAAPQTNAAEGKGFSLADALGIGSTATVKTGTGTGSTSAVTNNVNAPVTVNVPEGTPAESVGPAVQRGVGDAIKNMLRETQRQTAPVVVN